MISLKDGIRSLVRIDFQGRVHKHFRGTAAEERCKNEVAVLKELEERCCPNVPRLLEADEEENIIITTNCGRKAEGTISKKKAALLFAELEEKYGIRHDDPEPRNITYDSKLGRFCVIDFELAEILPLPAASQESTEEVVRLQWSGNSQQGRKHLTNQDSHLSLTINTNGNVLKSDFGEVIQPSKVAFFGISDGVGGNNGGEFASKLVLNTIQYKIEQEYDSALTLRRFSEMLQETHEALNKRATQNRHASKLSATFIGLIFLEDKILWGNVGDSRLYRFRNGVLEQLSKDHNFAFRKWKRGEMSELQYRTHPRKNILFDTMGGGHNSISPELGEDIWEKGDKFILCSDGIIDGLTDRKITSLLDEEITVNTDIPPKFTKDLCRNLLEKACANSGMMTPPLS